MGHRYVDLNRDPSELDPRLIDDVPDAPLSAKVAARIGVLPRLGGGGLALYDRRLSLPEGRNGDSADPYPLMARAWRS